MLIYITLSAEAFYFNEPLCHWPNWVAHDYGHRQMDKWMLTGNRTRTNLMTKPFVVVIRFAVLSFPSFRWESGARVLVKQIVYSFE